MTFESLLHRIPEIKSAELLGVDAQLLMAPKGRPTSVHDSELGEREPRYSAVMMLLYPKGDDTSILLIERANGGGVHAGQVGFPGGKYEESDQTLEVTALRETVEEVGIEPNQIEVLKEFTQVYISPSNFIVQPYLGVINHTPQLHLSKEEVANIIELPLKELLADSLVQEVGVKTSYANYLDVPAYVYKDYTIWGATAMMLSELKEILKGVYKY